MGNSNLECVFLKDIKSEKANFILTGYIPLPVQAVTMLNSEGGVGKSLLSLLIADKLSVLEDKKSLLWLSEDFPGQVRYIFEELINSGLAHKESLKNIALVKNTAIQLAYIENKIFKPNYREIEKIANLVLDVDAKLLVLDPLLSFYGGNENDNSQADIFMLSLIELAKLTDIAILLIHHNRKMNGENYGSFRGATAFHNACRMRYSLDYIRDDKGNIDKQAYNNGYRRLRLEKDNWGGRKYFNKLSNGNIYVDIKVAPGWGE